MSRTRRGRWLSLQGRSEPSGGKSVSGFTLIELMIVVVILSVLAAIAIPAFIGYVRRTKSSESHTNLSLLFRGATTYYVQERAENGVSAPAVSGCVVQGTALTPADPNAQKRQVDFPALASEWEALGFFIADPIYFSYQIVSVGAGCGHAAGENDLYTFSAQGDLDDDNVNSTYELAVGSDANNALYHARAIYIVNEAE